MALKLALYSNLSKGHTFPLTIRFSSSPECFKQFHPLKNPSFPIGLSLKPSLNPLPLNFSTVPIGCYYKSNKALKFVKPIKASPKFQLEAIEMGNLVKARSFSSGFRLRSVVHFSSMLRVRSFSSSYSQKVSGKQLPWLSSKKFGESKRLDKVVNVKSSRSSREAVKGLKKDKSGSAWEDLAGQIEKRTAVEADHPSSKEIRGRSSSRRVRPSEPSWKNSTETTVERKSNGESRDRLFGTAEDREFAYRYNEMNARAQPVQVEDREEEEESDVVDDPRWDRIVNKFDKFGGEKDRAEKPELRRWNKQENWGRKTWKEATESTLPKLVGEVVYGVGPVLAALSAGRREFYAVYVQEGLDLSGNNKKKKDKKGFEKVLRLAQKLGLIVKETSKHDLNMLVDNRPHQGLVLDASPLEMVKIMELDAFSPEENDGSLWVALDEVTDPQNLGAIIRSAYFFGASGVVLCAKNSAPLSGVVSKASAGSLELMELRYCKNMMQFLVGSADNGWSVIGGSVSSKAVPLNEVLPGQPTILVLGSEGTGLRPLVERSCSQLVRIPGNIPVDISANGNEVEDEETNLERSGEEFRSFLAVESLNVSVAAGVLLHHLIGNNNSNVNRTDESSTDVSERDL